MLQHIEFAKKNNLKKFVCDEGNDDVGNETESLTSLTSISSYNEDFMLPKTSHARYAPNEKKVENLLLTKNKIIATFRRNFQ